MKTLKLVLAITMMILVETTIKAQTPPVDDNGLAIGGYDVVSYFSGTAAKGESKYTVNYKGVNYRFSSKENQKTFKAEPAKYLPQFDGYCAWGISEKQVKFPITPETYSIVDGKLYLFFNGPFNDKIFNTIKYWNQETTRMVKDSHKHWPNVKNAN